MEQHFEMQETPRGVSFVLSDGSQFALPSRPEVETVGSLELMSVVRGVFDEAGRLQTATKAIKADAHLSEVGKVGKLQPLRVKALRGIARAVNSVDAEDQKLAARESKIFEVPQIDRADSVAAILDGELRRRFESLTARQRLQTVETIHQPQNERLMLALLRDPLPPQDALHEAVAGRWREAREAENVGDLREIRVARSALDWTRRAAYSAAAAVRRSAEMSPREIASALAGDHDAARGARAFSIGDDDIAAARAESSRRAA